MFHLAGIPSYLVVGELALNLVLSGTLPEPDYPEALRVAAAERWHDRARLTVEYARAAHAPRGRVTQCLGLLAQAALQTAHAVLAANGQWPTNEKRLLERAGMADVDGLMAAAVPQRLGEVVDAVAGRLGIGQ
jgi:hypothetical protein